MREKEETKKPAKKQFQNDKKFSLTLYGCSTEIATS